MILNGELPHHLASMAQDVVDLCLQGPWIFERCLLMMLEALVLDTWIFLGIHFSSRCSMWLIERSRWADAGNPDTHGVSRLRIRQDDLSWLRQDLGSKIGWFAGGVLPETEDCGVADRDEAATKGASCQQARSEKFWSEDTEARRGTLSRMIAPLSTIYRARWQSDQQQLSVDPVKCRSSQKRDGPERGPSTLSMLLGPRSELNYLGTVYADFDRRAVVKIRSQTRTSAVCRAAQSRLVATMGR
jgi:hypothetical protein